MKNLNLNQLVEQIFRLRKKKTRVIVSISGKSRSGKTTLSKKLHDLLLEQGCNSQLIHLEDWIVPISERTDDMDVYERFNHEKLVQDFEKLFQGEEVHFKAYEQETRESNKEEKSYKLVEEGVVIIDGVITLGLDVIYKASDETVFVEIREKDRYERIKETYHGKGLSDDEINDLYISRLEDEFQQVDKLKHRANTIINTPVI